MKRKPIRCLFGWHDYVWGPSLNFGTYRKCARCGKVGTWSMPEYQPFQPKPDPIVKAILDPIRRCSMPVPRQHELEGLAVEARRHAQAWPFAAVFIANAFGVLITTGNGAKWASQAMPTVLSLAASTASMPQVVAEDAARLVRVVGVQS